MAYRAIVFLTLLLGLALLAPARDDDEPAGAGNLEFRTHVHGFRIERPDAAWSVRDMDNPADGTFNVLIEPDGTPAGTVQVAVRVKEVGKEVTAEAARDGALKSLADRQDIKVKTKPVFEVAGRKAAGVVAEMEAMGQDFRIELAYLVENGRVYNLQRHAPEKDFAKYARAFGTIWDSFEFVEIREDTSPQALLRKLAERCGTEIDWHRTWEAAAEQARREKKLVVLTIRSLSSFQISDAAMTGPFMDPDVIGIVRERFVPLIFQKGQDAPFVPQGSSYGIGPSAFGSTILVATPEGEVVGDTFATEVISFHDFLIEHLARNPKLGGPPLKSGIKGLDRAERLIARGDYAEAEKILAEPEDARGWRLRAVLLRRLKQGDAALAALAAARAAPGGDEAAADIAADEALVLMRLGQFDKAGEKLDRLIADHPQSVRIPEALYHKGAVLLHAEDKAGAEKVWMDLVAAHPGSRWAAKAAGALTSTAFEIGFGERLTWPSREVLETLGPHDFEPWKASRAAEAVREATAFLLRTQRADGSWISPSEVVSEGGGEPNPFTVAITAICGQGLLPHADKPGVGESVDRALAYCLAAWEDWKDAEEKPYFMDYSVYSMSYMLWFMGDCIEAGRAKKEALAATAAELVEGIRSKQRSGGGWSYLITTELKNFDRPINQSISFYTAVALTALVDARETGFTVPAELIDTAAGCLERMRNPDCTFEYMLYHDREDAPRSTPVPGAAGRGPFCALALLQEGRGKLADIRTTLDQFLDNRHFFAREHGKSLMHAGPHAQGSHYLMFDYANCAAAVRRLPKRERGRYRGPLLEQILGARTEEGAYIDNPMIGPHYGAGMALIAFWNLDPKR